MAIIAEYEECPRIIKCEKQNSSKNERIWPQIVAILIVSLGNFTSGISFSWASPSSVVISRDKINYNITENEASYFIILQPLGMIFASTFFFKIAELLGRKKSLLSVAVPQAISWIITSVATSKWDFYVARFISGVSDACLYCSVPPYVGEITVPSVRGSWGNVPVFLLYGGGFFVTVIGSYLDVPTTALICLVFPILFFILVCFLPESPYQLIKDGKYNQAKASIKWFRRKPNIEEDFQNMKADVERQMSESGTWKDLFTIGSNRRALRAGMFLRTSQQLGGYSVFGAYTQIVFEKAGGRIDAKVSSMLFLGISFILTVVCIWSVERFGRKPSYFYSTLICGIMLVVMAIYFVLDEYKIADLGYLNWFPLTGMIIYVISYSFGVGVVPTMMLGELFSNSIKSKGLCLLITTFGIAIFFSSFMFRLLLEHVGLYCPYFVYSICCLVSTFLTLLWVPETKGKTLEEIQQSLKKF